jgi:hypothetical protein
MLLNTLHGIVYLSPARPAQFATELKERIAAPAQLSGNLQSKATKTGSPFHYPERAADV